MFRSVPLGPSTTLPLPRHAVPRRRRRIRRLSLGLWGVAGIGALAFGSAYASGLPSVGGATAADVPTATRTVDLAGAPTSSSLYGSAVTAQGPIDYSWSGRWGALATDEPLFYVDLAGHTGTFAAEVALTNAGALTNWYALQLKLEAVPVADAAACAAHDFTGASSPQVLYAETVDASVTFTGLDPAQKWCIGAAASDGKDAAGTYLRRVSTASVPTYPTLIASLAKTS